MKTNGIIDSLTTEKVNADTKRIDEMNAYEIVKRINEEDKKVALAVEKQLDKIARASEAMTKRYVKGGRIIYIGAGTSGRLGVMDAVELVPTYSVPFERAIAIMPGGEEAFIKAVEGAEDNAELAIEDLKKIQLCEKDIVIGIAASGRTPYTIGALEYANKVGALTISVVCNEQGKMNEIAQIPIVVATGAEVIAGSTRMKAGTAQKLVLNMLSTSTMIQAGYVYQNYMVYVQATNEKLIERARRMLVSILEISYDEACELFAKADNSVACAIVMKNTKCSREQAEEALNYVHGKVRLAIQHISKENQ